jgi:hypothetical protein
MGLLDSLFNQSPQGGGLLDFLRNNAMNQQFGSGLQSDQAQYGAPMGAMAQMQPMAQPNIQPQPAMPQAPAMQPAQPMPQQQPMPQEAAPGGFGAGVNGFISNLHTGPIGAIVGGIGSAAGLTDGKTAVARQQANQTAAYLRKAGVPEEAISAAVGNGRVPGNPEVLKTILAKYANQERVRPATPEERKQYGAPENLPMSIDTATGKPSYGPANTSISNVINGEKEQDKVIGKGYGERFNEIQKAGMTAPVAIGTLNLMEKLISDPSFYSGSGGETATALKRLAVSAGIAGAETATPNELFQKMSQKSVLDAAGGSLGTGFSNADREYLNGTVANISNTPEGNKRIIEVGRQVQQRNLEIAKQAREYARAHNGRLDSGFEDQIAEYAEKNPLFANAAPVATPKAASSGFQEGATATNPQTGAKLTFRNGKWQ